MNRASLLPEKRNDSTISENWNVWSAKVSAQGPQADELGIVAEVGFAQ
jgi:hypothetical protein